MVRRQKIFRGLADDGKIAKEASQPNTKQTNIFSREHRQRQTFIIIPFTMKTATMISSAFLATASAFAPRSNLAFSHATRAFSRSSVSMMAGNPKG
jgi:hypothetical protein